MSLVKTFYVNDSSPETVTFNGNEVKSVYFNNKKVWESYNWVGWENATWQDIYNLCKAKQRGDIRLYPSDVVLGATKWTTVHSSSPTYNGTATGVDMILIGIDIDGPGVLTFHAAGMWDTIARGQKTAHTMPYTIGRLTEFYNACSAKPYIKQLDKESVYERDIDNDPQTRPIPHRIVEPSYVWIPSLSEMGFSGNYVEYTSGVTRAYPYYSSNNKRKKTWVGIGGSDHTYGEYEKYMTRSLALVNDPDNAYVGYVVDGIGAKALPKSTTVNYVTHYSNSSGFAPAFAIG